MEYDFPGFDKPKELPDIGSPQMGAETLNPESSEKTPVKANPKQSPIKASEILKASGSETKGLEQKQSPIKTAGSDTGSEKSFQTAFTNVTDTDRNELVSGKLRELKMELHNSSKKQKVKHLILSI